MDRTARMTQVPKPQLAGLEKAIERIGGTAAKGRGAAVVAQTGEDEPTYGDVIDLAEDAGTFDLALKKAGADLPAGKVGRVRSIVQKFGPDVPVCKRCGDLAVDVVGGEALIRSEGQACPGCGEFLEESEAARPYVAWTTGHEVPPTISYDFDTTPGIRIPLTDAAIREQHEVSPALDALLAREGVTTIAFLLWLYHGPEKTRFSRATHKVLRFLADPDAETGHPNVTRNWVKAAKGYRASSEPSVTVNGGSSYNLAPTRAWHGSKESILYDLFVSLDIGEIIVALQRMDYARQHLSMRHLRGKPAPEAGDELQGMLERHGQLGNKELYLVLCRAFPGRAGDIVLAASKYDIRISPADLVD